MRKLAITTLGLAALSACLFFLPERSKDQKDLEIIPELPEVVVEEVDSQGLDKKLHYDSTYSPTIYPRRTKRIEKSSRRKVVRRTLRDKIGDFGSELERLNNSLEGVRIYNNGSSDRTLLFRGKDVPYRLMGRELFLTLPFNEGQPDLYLGVHFEREDNELREKWFRVSYGTGKMKTFQFKARYKKNVGLVGYSVREGHLEPSGFLRGRSYFVPHDLGVSRRLEINRDTMHKISDFLRFVIPIAVQTSQN